VTTPDEQRFLQNEDGESEIGGDEPIQIEEEDHVAKERQLLQENKERQRKEDQDAEKEEGERKEQEGEEEEEDDEEEEGTTEDTPSKISPHIINISVSSSISSKSAFIP
jgi:sRNA-binding protein